jgi:hypothetical protein
VTKKVKEEREVSGTNSFMILLYLSEYKAKYCCCTPVTRRQFFFWLGDKYHGISERVSLGR